MAKIRLTREMAMSSLHNFYRVFINGQVIGVIGGGECIEFEVPEGLHRIEIKSLKSDNLGSNFIHFKINLEETINFHCRKAWRWVPILIVLHDIFYPEKSIILEKKLEKNLAKVIKDHSLSRVAKVEGDVYYWFSLSFLGLGFVAVLFSGAIGTEYLIMGLITIIIGGIYFYLSLKKHGDID